MRYSRPSRGFALIELLLAFGVGILLISAGVAGFLSQNQDLKVRESAQGINRLVEIADAAYSTSSGYWLSSPSGADLATLPRIQASVSELPDIVIDQGAGVYSNPWDGTWSIDVESTTGTARDLLTITLTNVPAYACGQLTGIASPLMYDTLVNNSLVGLTPARTATAAGRNQTKVGQVAGLCDNDVNTIKFRRLKPVDYMMLRDYPLSPSLSARETLEYLPVYNRVEAALAARETAQVAIP